MTVESRALVGYRTGIPRYHPLPIGKIISNLNINPGRLADCPTFTEAAGFGKALPTKPGFVLP